MAFRGIHVGADTIAYNQIFYQNGGAIIPMNVINWLIPYQDARFENGFLLLNKIIYNIYPNFRLLLVVTSLIMIVCLAFFLIELNVNYVIGLISYESMLMPFSMNAMRQALAIALCMVAFVFLMKDHSGLFFMFNYLAITMHVTAWMFLIVFAYRKIKSGWKSKFLLLLGTVLSSILFEKIYGGISSISTEAQTFSNSVANNGSTGLMNITFSVALAFIIVVWLRHYTNFYGINNDRLVNASQLLLLTIIAFNIVAINFAQVARISMYFSIGYLPCLSLLCGGFNFKKDRTLVTIVIIGYLIIYFIFVQMFRPEWSGITPYVF